MKIQKSIIYGLITIVSLGVIALLIFWIPSLFADEFNYMYFTFSNDILTVSSNPSDLFEKAISKWTDVSATFRNNSQDECLATVRSETLDKSFNVASGLEYGVILPKKEDITVLFCGVQKIIKVN